MSSKVAPSAAEQSHGVAQNAGTALPLQAEALSVEVLPFEPGGRSSRGAARPKSDGRARRDSPA